LGGKIEEPWILGLDDLNLGSSTRWQRKGRLGVQPFQEGGALQRAERERAGGFKEEHPKFLERGDGRTSGNHRKKEWKKEVGRKGKGVPGIKGHWCLCQRRER